jgi:CubicO group peptidase (beta-lactamase class C family)
MHRLKSTRIATLLIALLPIGISTASASIPIDAKIRRVIEDIPPPVIVAGETMREASLAQEMLRLRVPGVSIAVIHRGRLEWARGFGVTREGGPEITPDTLFQTSSISKPITALAVLRLVDEGKLELDANVNRYLKSWKIPRSNFTILRPVTLRELLSHSAGATVDGFGGYAPGVPLPTLHEILDGTPPANNQAIRIDWAPGTIARYSGGGYVIIRQLLEDVTGQSFARFTDETVFRPLGMTHSTFEEPLPETWIADAALPHDEQGRALPKGPRIFPELAPDGLWSTPSDLARYIIAVQRSLAGRPGAVLKAATAHEMLTARLGHFGLGVVVGDDSRHPFFDFNGGNYGFPSLFVAFTHGEGAVVMSNGQNGYELGLGILRSIAREYSWPDFQPVVHHLGAESPRDLQTDPGAYEVSEGTFVVVTREGKRLFLQTSWDGRQPLLPLSNGKFFLTRISANSLFNREDDEIVSFRTGPLHTVDAIEFSDGRGTIRTARRLSGSKSRTVTRDMIEIALRYTHQNPAPGEATLLRRLLPGLADGHPDFSLMTARVASQVAAVVVLDEQIFAPLGPLKSMAFVHASPAGVDTFHLVFANGAGDMDIALGDDGKIRDLQWQ